jgi:membrane-associated protein
MNHKQFIAFDAIGCIAWTLAVTLVGFYLGSRVPGVEKLIEPILIGIILVFLLPTLYHASRDPKIRAALSRRFRRQK